MGVSAVVLVLALTCAVTMPLLAQRATSRLDGGGLTIDVVDDHAALYWATDELGRRCACAIAYEEPEWAWTGDLDISRDARSGRTVRASRRSSLHLAEPATDPMTFAATRHALGVLVRQYELATSARFEIRGDTALEVVPRSFRGADGRVVTRPPLIDTPITVVGTPALPAQWVVRVAQALSAATGREIRPLLSGNAVSLGAPMPFTAHAVPASEVVRRLFAGLPVDVAWRLSYAPTGGTFGLGIRTARRRVQP